MKSIVNFLTAVMVLVVILACSATTSPQVEEVEQKSTAELSKLSKAYFASGCFWCVEAIFESVEGVAEAVSGYSGGTVKNPTYEQISTGSLRHAEAVEVYYDPEVVSYATLLKVFFGSHDPTTPNRQGPDRGPQYRSVIFYQGDSEKALAENYIRELTESKAFKMQSLRKLCPLRCFTRRKSITRITNASIRTMPTCKPFRSPDSIVSRPSFRTC